MSQPTNHLRLPRLAAGSMLGLAAAAGSVAVAQTTPPPVNPAAPAARAAPAGQGAPSAAAAPPATPPAPGGPAVPAGRLRLDDVLDMLDRRGQTLDSFVADVSMTETDTTTALESTRLGKIWYQRLPDGQSRIRVSFHEKQNGRTRRPELLDYALDNGWLVERDHEHKVEVRRQVVRPGQKLDLFRLGDGPFPMPIGQKKEDVRKQFEADLVPVTPEDKVPAGTAHVTLTPRAKTDLRRQFGAVDVFVDPAAQMPIRIDTLDGPGVKSRSTTLRNVQVNAPLRDADFALPKIEKAAGWQETVEPMKP